MGSHHSRTQQHLVRKLDEFVDELIRELDAKQAEVAELERRVEMLEDDLARATSAHAKEVD